MFIIQPVDRGDGTKECCNKGSTSHLVETYRTSSVTSGDATLISAHNPRVTSTDESQDYWSIAYFENDASDNRGTDEDGVTVSKTGSVKFGVNCVKTITFEIIYDGDRANDSVSYYINLDGTQKASGTATGAYVEQIETHTITITPSPCGSVIEIGGTLVGSEDNSRIYIAAKITGVTDS